MDVTDEPGFARPAVRPLTHPADLTPRKGVAESSGGSAGPEEPDRRAAQRLASLERFAGVIAHDVNNLLGIILLNADMIAIRSPSGTDMERNLEAMRRAVLRAQEMMRRLASPSGEQASPVPPPSGPEEGPVAGREREAAGSEAEAISGTAAKILVMDDEEMILDFVRSALARTGFEVATAGDGDRAVRMYREAMEKNAPFDLVILDLTVRGGAGGLVTLHRLREIDPAVRAVASSGASEDPVINDFAEFGFAGRLVKPYGINGLRETLARMLGSAEPLP